MLKVMEVVVKVLVAMVERRGLPQDKFFLGIFSWLPPPHCPFSSSDLWMFPFLRTFLFSFSSFSVMELLVSWGLLVFFELFVFLLAAAAGCSVVVAAVSFVVVTAASASVSVVVAVVTAAAAAGGSVVVTVAAAAACVWALVCF